MHYLDLVVLLVMLRLGNILFSRPQRQHFRKKIPGFYAPYLGASFMKHHPVIPYRRLSPSLFHYPKTSKYTGKVFDWRDGEVQTGYEPIKYYGPNTIEIKGLPMGKTPEYIQERLRRYFAKFGRVTFFRAIPHPLDPYQCEGTAYVTFRDFSSCEAAVKSVVRLGSREMGNKILSMRVLQTDETHDGAKVIENEKARIDEVVNTTRRLYDNLVSDSQMMATVDSLPLSVDELKAISLTYKSTSQYLNKLRTLFVVTEDGSVHPRRLVDVESEIFSLRKSLEKQLDDSLSVDWRCNAPIKDLPEYTKRQIRLWDKKDPLPFDLQILSRDMRQHRVFDEKFLVEAKKKRERAWNRAENRKAAIAKRKGGQLVVSD